MLPTVRPLFLPIPTSIRAYWGQSLGHCTPQPITGDFFDAFSLGVPTVLWSVQVPAPLAVPLLFLRQSPNREREGKGDEEVGRRVGEWCAAELLHPPESVGRSDSLKEGREGEGRVVWVLPRTTFLPSKACRVVPCFRSLLGCCY